MCEPTTATMMYMAIASTAVSAGGMLMQAKSQKNTAKYNAKMKDIQNADIKNKAIADEEAVRRKGAQLKAQQMAELASNGLEVTTGSASDLLADTEMMTELDAQTVRNNAEKQIYFGEAQKQSILSEGRNSANQSYMGAVATGFSGASKAIGIHNEFGEVGGDN